MKSSELCKICHKLIFPKKFKKKGRLAYPYYGSKNNQDEYFALTYYLLEYYRKSVHFLDKIISLNKRDDSNLFLHQIENAQLLKGYIETGEYDKGVSQILQWQEQTIKGIGLKINDQRL